MIMVQRFEIISDICNLGSVTAEVQSASFPILKATAGITENMHVQGVHSLVLSLFTSTYPQNISIGSMDCK
jgi:hypothetical protein